MCPVEEDDEEIEYGRLYEHSLEESQFHSPIEADDIWPHWGEGVPTRLRRKLWSPAFLLGKVHHHGRLTQDSIELEWSGTHLLSTLRQNYHLLPSGKYSSEWNGVYRIFSPNAAIDRLCGKDLTGTLYIGRAGSERGWSILRVRIMQIARQEHHAVRGWSYSNLMQQKYPWETLAVQWAYTADIANYKGETVGGSKKAEGWLLSCYKDSYGEYPPLNEEG